MKRIIIFALISLLVSIPLTACKGEQTEETDPMIESNEETVGQSTPPSESAEEDTSPEYQKLPFKFTMDDIIEDKELLTYAKFNGMSDPAYLVPALNQYFVPQGIEVWREMNWLMISGYFSDSSICKSSVLLALDITTGEYVGEYYITDPDGSEHTGHAGGIAVSDKNLYISNGGKLLRISLEAIKNANRLGKVTIEEEISVPVRASFCNYSAGILWVGDFYESKSYKTDEFRHLKNRAGKTYYAWCVGYTLDSSESGFSEEKWNSSLEYATPDYILSIDQKIQGFTVVSDEYIALSQSYGRKNNSTIYLYENILETTPHRYYTLNGKDIPLWFLDSKLDCESIKALPMSEGLASLDGKLFILFESGADKYRNDGGKNPTDSVWVMNMP